MPEPPGQRAQGPPQGLRWAYFWPGSPGVGTRSRAGARKQSPTALSRPATLPGSRPRSSPRDPQRRPPKHLGGSLPLTSEFLARSQLSLDLWPSRPARHPRRRALARNLLRAGPLEPNTAEGQEGLGAPEAAACPRPAFPHAIPVGQPSVHPQRHRVSPPSLPAAEQEVGRENWPVMGRAVPEPSRAPTSCRLSLGAQSPPHGHSQAWSAAPGQPTTGPGTLPSWAGPVQA